MDALFRKVKKSPSVTKGDSRAVRHEKLGEGWAENKQPVAGDDGVVFYLKYLGFTLVDEVDDNESYGDGTSAKAVQRIVTMAKSEGKKLKKVALRVSCQGIHIVDIITKEIVSDITVYRISFCTADRYHDKVFAFIARNTINETMECHAFLCARTKIAQAVTLTVWQAFNVAHDKWREQQHKKSLRSKDKCSKPQVSTQPNTAGTGIQATHNVTHHHSVSNSISSSPFKDSFADFKISDIHISNEIHHGTNLDSSQNTSGDEDDLEDCFSQLAEIRGRGHLPSFSTDLRKEDVDEGVHQYMNGQHCFEEFSRQKSSEDLMSL